MTDAELLAGRSPRFRAAVEAIDAANADDPERLVVDGEEVPKELTHARMMCAWVLRLDPDADERQLLAARAHHLRRWDLPRSTYPEGRSGYLRWRSEQNKRHAERVGSILHDAGYDDADVERVQHIIQKRGLGRDRQVQVHEDALCLVFLATQFGPTADKLGEERMVDVLAKTLQKMSPAGRQATVELGLDAAARRLVERASEQLTAD